MAPFTSMFIAFNGTSLKELYSYVDEIDTQISDDDTTHSNEVHCDTQISGLINCQEGLNFIFLSNHLSTLSYFFNTQEIYLGLSTPPPKISFS